MKYALIVGAYGGLASQIIDTISNDYIIFAIDKNPLVINKYENIENIYPFVCDITDKNNVLSIKDENVKIAHDVMDLKEYVNSDEECFVIGGAMIYNLLLPYVEKMYVTEIDKEFEGDSFFPKIKEEDWKEIERIEGPKDDENNFKYEYVTYIRKD